MSSARSTESSFDKRLDALERALGDKHAELVEERELRIRLQQKVEWFERQVFGEKSEKRHAEVVPGQMDIAELLGEPHAANDASKPATKPVAAHERRLGKSTLEGQVNDTGLQFDDTVPVEVIDVRAPQLEGPGADEWVVIDYKHTFRLARRPADVVILDFKRPVLKRRTDLSMVTTPAPPAVLDKSYADVTLLAGLLVQKFCYHSPLYREHQKLADAGVKLARSTLTALVRRAIALLMPVAEAQWQDLLLNSHLAMDETPIKAGRGKPGKMKRGYFWPIYGENDEVSFLFAPSRGKACIERFLKGFTGTLLSDGYDAYARYAKATEGIVHALCWVHTRRAFEKAQKDEPDAVAQALAFIGDLYRFETEIGKQGLGDVDALAYRQSHSKLVVEQFFDWCGEQRQRIDLTPSNRLSKALNYATTREAGLKVFLDDARVAPDTNHLERALRVVPMGRRNWLFCWTEAGAEQVAAIQSLLVTCRLHDINPYVYLVDVLQRVDLHPASDVAALTPRLWKQRFGHCPIGSTLDELRRSV